jgi:uncharacterized protein (DUF58 family)
MRGLRSEVRGHRSERPFESSVDARQRRTLGVPPEILRQVRLLELRTRGLVNSVFAGEYRSVFKGQGMEFAEVREYQPGDEVRSIDWNVSARTGRMYVKRYVEERELTVMVAVDCSGSEYFGTARRFKQELAAEVAALLTMSAVRNNDRIGVLLFSDRVEHVVPPRKGRRHALRVIRDVLVHEPEGRGTDIAGALEYLRGMLTSQHAIVFLLSDLMEEGLERALKLLSQRHDLVVATIEDPREAELPNVGLARFVDPETGATVELDTGDARVRSGFKEAANAQRLMRRKMLRRLAIDEIPLKTNVPYIDALLRFFRTRERRRGRARRR